MALKRHKNHISNRYFKLTRAGGDDFVGGNHNDVQAFLAKTAQVIVRMRGLPYDCTAKQVLEFFENGNEESSCKVMDGEDGILFVKKPDGRATGDAFVLFASEEDVPKALSKHKELIGTRYIELFRSTTSEVQQVLNRTLETALPPSVTPISYLPQHVIASGSRKDCIRLRGLPYEASVEHILDFLGEYAKNILLQGVHMVYNSQGHPSGEAFIQMDSEHSAFMAAQIRHHRFMNFGKKQRYIEVFQCSGEDMSHMLFGGIPAPSAGVSSVGKPLLSLGMFNAPTLLPVPVNQPSLTATAALPVAAGNNSNTAAASLVPQSAMTWDPLSAQVALQMHQAALAQVTYRSQQEYAWLTGQLAAQQHLQQLQQQMQLAALASVQKTPWTELSAAASSPALMQSWPVPSSPQQLTSVSPVVSAAAETTTSAANHSKQKSIISSPGFSTPNSILLPQASTMTTTANQQPFVFINVPRFSSPVSPSYPSKVSGIGSNSSGNQGTMASAAGSAFNIPQNQIIPSTAQYAANILKRSWENAFSEGVAAPNVAAPAATIKRPFCMSSASNAPAAMYTFPSHPQAAAQPSASAVTFQPAQFFPPN